VTATGHRDNRRGSAVGVPGGGSVRVLPINHGSGSERGGADGGDARDGQIAGTLLAAGPFLTLLGSTRPAIGQCKRKVLPVDCLHHTAKSCVTQRMRKLLSMSKPGAMPLVPMKFYSCNYCQR
jgi:hypothetical protein